VPAGGFNQALPAAEGLPAALRLPAAGLRAGPGRPSLPWRLRGRGTPGAVRARAVMVGSASLWGEGDKKPSAFGGFI